MYGNYLGATPLLVENLYIILADCEFVGVPLVSAILPYGVAAILLEFIEIGGLYFLTEEFLTREMFLLYGDAAFTFAWAVLPQLVSVPSTQLIDYTFVGFLTLTAVLCVLPLLIYLVKARALHKLQRAVKGLKGIERELADKYTSLGKGLGTVQSDLEGVAKTVKDDNELYEMAKKTPEVIISGRERPPVLPAFPQADINYVIVGLGGVGISLLESVIDYLRNLKLIVEGRTNPYLFVAFDTNFTELDEFVKKYRDTEVRTMICYAPLNPQELDAGPIFQRNPWFVGEPAQILMGTGFRRGLGFAAYNTIRDSFTSQIVGKIRQLVEGRNNNKTAIVILNSLGGGTGSGTFLNFAIDIKEKLQAGGMTTPPIILGFGILPKKIEEPGYLVNAYGALKELQFLLDMPPRAWGEVSGIMNPFTTYFLVSRNSDLPNRDEQMSFAITRLIFDLGSAGFDLGDISRTLLETGLLREGASGSFSTFDYYSVYFPASRISWYMNLGRDDSTRVRNSFNSSKVESANLEQRLESYKGDVGRQRSDLEGTRTKLSSFILKKVYKHWEDSAEEMKGDVGLMLSEVDIDGKLHAAPLQKDLNSIKESLDANKPGIPYVEKEVHQFELKVNDERDELRQPLDTALEKRFAIADPDNFDVSGLVDENSTMRSLLQRLGRTEELERAFDTLTNPLGTVGMTMANLDYRRINTPIKVDNYELEFIRRYPAVTRLGGERSAVSYPAIKAAMLAVASKHTNLEEPPKGVFPREDRLRAGLSPHAVSPNVRVTKPDEAVAMRYSLSSYRLLTGIYIWHVVSSDDPMLTDVKYLEEAYNDSVEDAPKRMFRNHSLFYDKQDGMIEGIDSRDAPITMRDKVTRFWTEYDPAATGIGVWGMLALARAYSISKTLLKCIDSSIQSLNEMSARVGKGTLDRRNSAVVELKKALRELLDASDTRRLPGQLERVVAEASGNEEIGGIIDAIKEDLENLKQENERLSGYGDKLLALKDKTAIDGSLVMELAENLKVITNRVRKIQETLSESLTVFFGSV